MLNFIIMQSKNKSHNIYNKQESCMSTNQPKEKLKIVILGESFGIRL